jgi:hypothetical protein
MDISAINSDVFQALEAQFLDAALAYESYFLASRQDDERHCEYLRGVANGIKAVLKSLGTTKAEIVAIWDKAQAIAEDKHLKK